MTRAQTQQALRQLPVKWALALLTLIVIYALAQPALNSRLGWNLPSLARLLGEPEPKPNRADAKDTDGKVAGDRAKAENPDKSAAATAAEQDTTAATGPAGSEADPQPKSKRDVASKTPIQPGANETKGSAEASNSTLLYGILKETGRNRYVSIEGLQYNPGSEEGHRLKHLERHLKDIPDRPGKHGVFDGEMKDALKWIDDAYARGKRGAKGVRKTQEDGRTIYEAPFTQSIGYIGGRDGKRSGNPPAKRLRLVVEGSNFITAFPF